MEEGGDAALALLHHGGPPFGEDFMTTHENDLVGEDLLGDNLAEDPVSCGILLVDVGFGVQHRVQADKLVDISVVEGKINPAAAVVLEGALQDGVIKNPLLHVLGDAEVAGPLRTEGLGVHVDLEERVDLLDGPRAEVVGLRWRDASFHDG